MCRNGLCEVTDLLNRREISRFSFNIKKEQTLDKAMVENSWILVSTSLLTAVCTECALVVDLTSVGPCGVSDGSPRISWALVPNPASLP